MRSSLRRKQCCRSARFVTLVVCTLLPCIVHCQSPDSPSIGLFARPGLQHDTGTRAAFQGGGSYEQYAPNHWIGYSLEGGYVASFSKIYTGSALISLNYISAWSVSRSDKLFPFATAGYSYLVGTGHAVNFGTGVDIHLKPSLAIRVEARDYFAVSSPHQHNFAIRLGVRRFFWD